MLNTFGHHLQMTIFGESHGPAIGVVLDGLPAGFEIDLDQLEKDMDKRKAKGKISTQRKEADQVHFVSGFFNGRTTGSPLCMMIENTNTRPKDYSALQYRLRPGHADYTAFEKYDGYQDYRGGGHFSGRLTACIVAAGSICRQILKARQVEVGTHILSLGSLQDEAFNFNESEILKQFEILEASEFPVLDSKTGTSMVEIIEQCAQAKDSIGGILQSCITGLPAGVGEPFFESLESSLSALLFSIPACKGVSFGAGFDFAGMKGSQANDPLAAANNGKITFTSNNNGGINGGISNGMPIVLQTVIKPTPSIFLKQQSVDYETKEPVELEIKGRHDPAIIHRAAIVQTCILAFGILDAWMIREGTLYFQKEAK